MEQAVVFGTHENLTGIVTEPNASGRLKDVAVVMVTPGMLHNVGPFRMHVELARRLSGHGVRSMRFDLSGIGDSLGVGVAGRSIDRAAAEVATAMDWMSDNCGNSTFILFGLCSGADDSMHAALQDDRVKAVVAIDGCGYRTPKFFWHRLISHYVPRLLSPVKWRQIAGRKIRGGDVPPTTLQAGSDVREFPSREEAVKQFNLLVSRGTHLHFVYTGGIAEYYNHDGQFYEMLRGVNWRGQESTQFFPHMDHVALLCEDREQLLTHVVAKITSFADSIAASSNRTGDTQNVMTFDYPAIGSDGIAV